MTEQVKSIWDYYDGPRTGIANFNGEMCHFECEWDEEIDNYSDTFKIRLLNESIILLADEYNDIWRTWEIEFHAGKISRESHPGIKGQNPRFLELEKLLKSKIHNLDVLATKIPEFSIKHGQEDLPKGIIREMEVEWNNVI